MLDYGSPDENEEDEDEDEDEEDEEGDWNSSGAYATLDRTGELNRLFGGGSGGGDVGYNQLRFEGGYRVFGGGAPVRIEDLESEQMQNTLGSTSTSGLGPGEGPGSGAGTSRFSELFTASLPALSGAF
ncbi:hypothetical protein M422DRAFT_23866, partial [Sphaerobolus stellatus SS14]